MKLLLTVREAAETLSLSEATVWRLLERGDIPSVKIGRSRRIKTDDLRAYVNSPKRRAMMY